MPTPIRGLEVAALAFATFATWSCKAGPGPPPLAPGADPGFERRLAELDSRYRFVFSDSTRIFEARMRGDEETVLLDLEKRKRSGGLTVSGWRERSPTVTLSGDPPLSPDGRWLLVPYFVADFPHQYDQQLLLLDVHSREVRLVPLPRNEGFDLDGSGYAGELFHWLTADRFVVSFSHYPDGGGVRKKFYDYDLADLSSPRAVTGFGDLEPVIYQVPGTGTFLWGRSDEPTNSWTIHVFDASGFRDATREEKEVFDSLYFNQRDPVPNGPREVVLDSYHNAEPLFDFEDARSHWDVRFGMRLVYRTWSAPSLPRWDDELSLYTWSELGDPGDSYVMDAEGRYRHWHRGELLFKLPRATVREPSERRAAGRS